MDRTTCFFPTAMTLSGFFLYRQLLRTNFGNIPFRLFADAHRRTAFRIKFLGNENEPAECCANGRAGHESRETLIERLIKNADIARPYLFFLFDTIAI